MHTPPSKHQNKLPLSLVVGFDIYTAPPHPVKGYLITGQKKTSHL